MALSPQDLQLLDVPVNDAQSEEQALLDFSEVEALIEARSQGGDLQHFLTELHATFADDDRLIHQLSPEALNVYFNALEETQGLFMSDLITKKKPAKKAKAPPPPAGEL